MTIQIPAGKMDFLKQLSSMHGIKIADLTTFFETKLNDPAVVALLTEGVIPPTEEEIIDYASGLLNVYVSDCLSAVMEEFSGIFIIAGRAKESKKGGMWSNSVFLGKRTGEGDKTPKLISIRNGEDSGMLYTPILALDTGKIKVSVGEETPNGITGFAKPASEFIKEDVDWIPKTRKEKIAYLKKIIKNVKISEAGKNVSPKDEKSGYANAFGLRLIHGTVSGRRITKKIDPDTKKESLSANINIVDDSVQMNGEFFKTKQVVDPKDPTKKKTLYGGFGGFCDPEDVEGIDRGSVVDVIGYINDEHNMQVGAVIPTVIVIPKKPSEKLKLKPGNSAINVPAGQITEVPITTAPVLDPSQI